jgi:hypothetical protein
MSKDRHSSKNTSSLIPEEFDPYKYNLNDDFSIWKASLGRRVALRHELDEFLSWRNSVGELSAQRVPIKDAWLLEIQNKVWALIEEPISVSRDDKNMAIGSKLLNRDDFLQQNKPISDRLYIDEAKSASKIQDQFFINIFDRKRAELAKNPNVDAATRFIESYEMWRADIQMPDFSGKIGINVNLFYSDEILCNAFSKWLKATRAEANPRFSPHKAVDLDVLKEWKRMQILPCIDLRLYLDAFNVNPGWNAIGTSLYGDPDEAWGDVAQRAKTADHRGKELLNPFSFYSLRFEGDST